MAAKKRRSRKTISSRSGPDRDTNGQVRLEFIEDWDPQSGGTWHSFQIMATVRLSAQQDYDDLAAALPNAAVSQHEVDILQRASASEQMIALYRAAKGNKGTGGVPNLLLSIDFGGARTDRNFKGRLTIHTEVFLIRWDQEELDQLWQVIKDRDGVNAARQLDEIGTVTSPSGLTALLVAALKKPSQGK